MALAEYGNAFNIDTDANGDPILIDAQSGQTVATYDRTQSAWVYGDIISDSVNTDILNNADLANASTGTMPVSQGDGTLAMESGGGGGDIASDDVNRIDVQATEPSSPTENDIWIETS